MVLGNIVGNRGNILEIMSLLADLECIIQVIPYHHEGTGAVGDLPRLIEAFESELFQFGDGLGV